MGEISELIGAFVVVATLPVVTIFFFLNMATAHPRPLPAAVVKAQTLISRWAVWLALALLVLYGVLQSLERWSLWELFALLVGPSVGIGIVLLALSIRVRRTHSSSVIESPPTTSHAAGKQGVVR